MGGRRSKYNNQVPKKKKKTLLSPIKPKLESLSQTEKKITKELNTSIQELILLLTVAPQITKPFFFFFFF